ncbi:MAG: hypothetical protein KGJ34_00330, partial [Patescibacteria group bacterium]|nr:hypothetical protein [Patescibacteria group bacterium]
MRRWVLLSVLFLIVVGTFGYVVYESTRPPAPTSSATAPSCTPLQLSGSASWEGISGGLVGAIQLTNTSPSACTFTPENFSIASNGQTLSINQVASSSGAVLLQPSTSARTQFVWRNWCAPLLTAPAQIGINLPNGETFSVPVLGPSGTPQSNTPQCDNMEASSTLFVSTFSEGGGGVTAYTSQMLGISFEYDSSQASVLEQGNTIYVYPIGAPSTGGDLIEMFSKFPGETLQQSITRQLLT